MQDHEVVVIGGGSTGCSILYHLAKAGVKDALLLDMAPQLAAGQTSRSTALVRTHYSTEVLTRMALLSYRFFKGFGREPPGRSAGYVETGLLVGADEASVEALRQNSAMHKSLGIDSRVMNPEELSISKIEPMLDAAAFSLFAYEPNAGYAEPSSTASSIRVRRGRARRQGPLGGARHQDRARSHLQARRLLGHDDSGSRPLR